MRLARGCAKPKQRGRVIGAIHSSGVIVTSSGAPVTGPVLGSYPAPAGSSQPGSSPEPPSRPAHKAGGKSGEGGGSGSGSKGGGSPGQGEGGLPQETGGVLTDPIDPRYLTKLPFGTSSFWIQPWRAYLDTWSSSTLLNALGINFNVSESDADDVARLLQDSGFKLARKEIPWGALSYEDPTQFNNEPKIRTILTAMHDHGLRPLLMLNANSGLPAPALQISLSTVAAAAVGATTVKLDAASAAKVVPGKTGFDELTFGTGPDILLTSVSPSGVATLSRPLRKPLAAGKHRAMTLRYAPFERPTLENGEPNPVFQETLAGWLSYVATVCREASSIFGPEGYDLEIWNELSFGSQFLNSEHYYQASGAESSEAEEAAEAGEGTETEASPEARENSQGLEGSEAEVQPEDEGETAGGAEGEEEGAGAVPASKTKDAPKLVIDKQVTKLIRRTLLKETVNFVRNPENGIGAGVGITDGFASQTPFPSGANAPLGLTALSKHLYGGAKTYPADYPNRPIRPIDALGFRDSEQGTGAKPLFIPNYQSLFPELYLSGTHTETITRDIAPITTDIYGLAHGREVGPAGGEPVQKWMTEYNLSPNKGTPMGPDGVTPANVTLSAADKAHFQAKALLRSLVAMVNKGMNREYFFAAAPGGLSLISGSFFSALESNPGSYPGDEAGGETMKAFHNLLGQFQGPGPSGAPRQIKLLSIAQDGNHAQFSGDGTAAHPDLYDRDVLAVLPFQSSPGTFVIPVYVMTRDLLTLYEPGQPAGDVDRFDLPDETFRITLGNLPEGGQAPSVSAYDPLHETSTPAHLLSRSGDTAELEIAASDYPRLLRLEYP